MLIGHKRDDDFVLDLEIIAERVVSADQPAPADAESAQPSKRLPNRC